MSELKSFIVLYDGKFIRAYEESEVDAVITELKDKIQQKDFFWEGCGFSKMGFKNTIDVAKGLDYYYMAKNDRRTLTKEDYELAKRTLPTLPDGWYRERHEWDAAKW